MSRRPIIRSAMWFLKRKANPLSAFAAAFDIFSPSCIGPSIYDGCSQSSLTGSAGVAIMLGKEIGWSVTCACRTYSSGNVHSMKCSKKRSLRLHLHAEVKGLSSCFGRGRRRINGVQKRARPCGASAFWHSISQCTRNICHLGCRNRLGDLVLVRYVLDARSGVDRCSAAGRAVKMEQKPLTLKIEIRAGSTRPDHAASRARSCGWPRSTGVPFGMIPVGFTLAIE